MRSNRVRDIWAAGGNVVNAWLASSASFSAEVMAMQDFDAVSIDLQHGMVDFNQAVSIFQAISAHAPTCMARIPWNDPTWIMKTLDAGALGLICPMINTAEEAERFVSAMRYPPHGSRSFSGVRGPMTMGPDYFKNSAELVIAFAMIETRQALDNLDEIIAVEGLDAVYIGPSDLAISMGYDPVADPTEPEVLEAIEHIRRTAADAGVYPCIHTAGGDHAKRMFEQGFRLCTLANEVRLMAQAAEQAIKIARS